MPDEQRLTCRIVEMSTNRWRLFTITGTAGETHHDFPSREAAEAAAKSLATRAARLTRLRTH